MLYDNCILYRKIIRLLNSKTCKLVIYDIGYNYLVWFYKQQLSKDSASLEIIQDFVHTNQEIGKRNALRHCGKGMYLSVSRKDWLPYATKTRTTVTVESKLLQSTSISDVIFFSVFTKMLNKKCSTVIESRT